MTRPAIVWFREDLRLADKPALAATVERGGRLIQRCLGCTTPIQAFFKGLGKEVEIRFA